jgi:hypothetical protein
MFWNFGLDEIGELLPHSAPRIDLHQAEARFFQAASSALLRIQTTRLITWKKKGLLDESNRSLCKKSHSPPLFTTGFPSHPARACLFWACTDGASGWSRHGR